MSVCSLIFLSVLCDVEFSEDGGEPLALLEMLSMDSVLGDLTFSVKGVWIGHVFEALTMGMLTAVPDPSAAEESAL